MPERSFHCRRLVDSVKSGGVEWSQTARPARVYRNFAQPFLYLTLASSKEFVVVPWYTPRGIQLSCAEAGLYEVCLYEVLFLKLRSTTTETP